MSIDQVTDTLYITDIHGVQQNSTSGFDAIITICQDSVGDNIGSQHYHHFPLADGEPPEDAFNPGECSYELFADAVHTIIEHVAHGRQTLVHCHAGQSRSAMAIAAALTELENTTFNDAYNTVSDSRGGGISPSTELRESAMQYANNGDSE